MEITPRSNNSCSPFYESRIVLGQKSELSLLGLSSRGGQGWPSWRLWGAGVSPPFLPTEAPAVWAWGPSSVLKPITPPSAVATPPLPQCDPLVHFVRTLMATLERS